jgi:RNA polymerase sigma-70 factor (ECF subfamily)
MTSPTDRDRDGIGSRPEGERMNASDLDNWFVREVLPLESALTQFLRRSWRNRSDVDDLCQEVYVRVYEAAQKEIPDPVRPFVFAVARNLIINRVRREQIVPIESLGDLDALNIAADEPGPDRNAMAREELRRLQSALDNLPPRCRQAVVLKKIEGLSRKEIAQRMGISEDTVHRHLTEGRHALADLLYGEDWSK